MNRVITLFCLSLFACSACDANAAIPLGMYLYPSAILFLIPIIVIEAVAFKKSIENITWGQGYKAVTLSNLASTLAGFLFLTPLLIVIELVLRYAAAATKEKSLWGFINSIWFKVQATALNADTFTNPFINILTVIIGMTLAMIPFYFLSVWIEGLVNKRLLVPQGFDAQEVKRVTWRANLYSYFFLIVALSYLSFTHRSFHIIDKMLSMIKH